MKSKVIFTLAKKEFFVYINSTLAYTVIVPFLLLSTFLYTRTVLISGEATLRPFFDLLPWFLLLLAPALSMRLLTDEYQSQTLELLFAHPISELEIILGKFFGALTFFVCILLTTIGLPLTLFVYSKPSLGQIVGQYIGALFVGGTFLAIGLAASAWVKNAISSFLLSVAVGFTLFIVGLDFIALMLSFPLDRIAVELSILSHMENITRGLIDVRDIAYFLTISGLFLVAGVTKLSERKIAEDKREKSKLRLAFSLIVGIGIIANLLLSSYPVRLDLTEAKLFTLSKGTKQTIENLPDIVNLTLYASRDLPAELQLIVRETTDLLKDYEQLSKNIKVRVLHPDENFQIASDAQSAGVREVQLNKISAGKFELQTGFLGLVIRYADKTETIPFISDASDLEYQITRRIRKLTSDKEKVIAIYKSGFSQNQLFEELLRTQYKTEIITPDHSDRLKETQALVIIDDGNQESTTSAFIKDYLNENGQVLLLASGVTVNPQFSTAQKSRSAIPDFLDEYGITLNRDLVYDLQLSETLAFEQKGRRYLAQYPYWLRALPAESDFPPLATIKSINLGWPSSLTLEEKPGFSYRKLLTTGKNAGRLDDNFNISPQAASTLVANAEEKLLLALAVEKDDMRLIVVGSSTVADDRFLQNNRDNIAFLSNTVDWLATDKDLAAIPSKSGGHAVFEFKSPADILLVEYGNLFIPPILVISFAVFYLRRRKRLTKRIYEK